MITFRNLRPSPRKPASVPQRICRNPVVLLATIALFGATGCKNEPPLPDRPARRNGPLAVASYQLPDLASSAAPRPELSPETRRTLATLRNETLRFVPRDEPARRLEFFGNQLARLTRDALFVVAVPQKQLESFDVPKKIRLSGGRELARLADHSLLVIDANSTLLFNADGIQQNPLGKVTYFPTMQLWPELRKPKAFATFDPNHGSLSLYRWDTDTTPTPRISTGVLLPQASVDWEALSYANCTLLANGAYACHKDAVLYSGWPGYAPKRLGTIAPGATVVRLVPGARADRVHVLRSDARLEEYWAVAPTKQLATIALPWVPLEVARLKAATAVLQLSQADADKAQFRLIVVEADGKPRWTSDLDSVPTPTSPEGFDREVLACRNLAVHPLKPWLAVSNCQGVLLFDAQNGKVLAELKNTPF